MSARVAIYTLRIMGPDFSEEDGWVEEQIDAQNQRAVDIANAGPISAAEDLISSALPDGYYAKIEDA
jgi:hypothetical protein